MFRRQLARAPLIAAFLLLFCAGCGSGKAPAVPAGTLVLGPQETCDRDLAKSPPDVTVYGADAGDYLADRFSVAGTAEDCVRKLRRAVAAGATQFWMSVHFDDKVRFMREWAGQVMPAFR